MILFFKKGGKMYKWAASTFVAVLIVFDLYGSALAQGLSAPINVKVTRSNWNSLQVQWIANNSNSYRFEVSYGNRLRTVSRQRTTLYSLRSNTRYLIRVRAVSNHLTNSNYSEGYGITRPMKPKRPIWISSNSSSITVQLDHVDEGSAEKSYIIVCRDGHDRVKSKTTTNETIATISNLLENTKYKITVTAFNEAGKSIPSVASDYYTAPSTPSPVSISSTENKMYFHLKLKGSGEVHKRHTVQWAPPSPSGENSFDYYVEGTVRYLESNTAYKINITASNKAGSSMPYTTTVVTLPAQPYSATWTSSNSSSVTVEWEHRDEGPVERSYRVIWRDSHSRLISNTTTNKTTATVTNLQENSHYECWLTAINEAGESEYRSIRDCFTAPSTPKAPMRANSTASTITVHRNEDSQVVSEVQKYFTLHWSPPSPSGRNSTKRFNSSEPKTIDYLQSNTAYKVSIMASNQVGSSGMSDTTTIVTLPATPKSTTWVSSTSSSITVQLHPVDEGPVEKSYIIVWRDNNNRLISNTTTNKTIVSISNLQENSEYHVEVTASNKAGESAPSSLSCYTAPNTPKALERTTSTISTITVHWNEDSQAVSGVTKYYTLQWNPLSLLGRSSRKTLSSDSTTIGDLQSNTAYNVSIMASNQAGSSMSDAMIVMTLPQKPARPLWINSTSSTIDLQWMPKNEGPVEKLYTVSWYVTPIYRIGSQTGIQGTSTTISGLLSNTAYTFQVTAVNSAGTSLESEGKLILTVPTKASTPIKTAITSSSISIRWDAAFEGTERRYYKVDWTSTFDNSRGSGQTAEIEYTAANLKPNTAYAFTVTARNEAGYGLTSDQIIFETDTELSDTSSADTNARLLRDPAQNLTPANEAEEMNK